MTIPQTDPRAGYVERKDEIDRAIAETLDRGWYINGREVSSFEAEFAAAMGLSHAVGVASGTDALHLALRALELGPGDEVVTVSHTAVATVAAIELSGATPVLVDIDEASYAMSPARLAEVLAARPRIKAVVVVHLYGHAADMPAILALTQPRGVRVIEDCAQSHGAAIGDRFAGTFGDVAAYSFYPTKNLGALGDGGALATSDTALAERVRVLREYGWKERYISYLPGMNTRLDELQAAILRVKLRYLAGDNERRRAIARVYDERLENVARPHVSSGIVHAYHQYVVRSTRRDALREHLAKSGIGSAIHYPAPVHLQPAYEGRVALGGELPVTERVRGEILSLPMYAQLTLADAERVCESVRSFR